MGIVSLHGPSYPISLCSLMFITATYLQAWITVRMELQEGWHQQRA